MQVFNDSLVELRSLVGEISLECDGYALYENITVPEPSGPKDELCFTKLVAWSYVLLNEAFPVCLKQIVGVMRQSEPEMYKHFQATRDIVDSLRTFQSHNLPVNSKRNENRVRDINAWKLNNGGSPFSWESCCSSLCQSINKLLRDLRHVWNSVSSETDDKNSFIEALKRAFANEWPAHIFDDVVARCAVSIGLRDFDSTAFRKSKGNVDNWRVIVSLFNDRKSAEDAVERAIKSDLIGIFGLSGES